LYKRVLPERQRSTQLDVRTGKMESEAPVNGNVPRWIRIEAFCDCGKVRKVMT